MLKNPAKLSRFTSCCAAGQWYTCEVRRKCPERILTQGPQGGNLFGYGLTKSLRQHSEGTLSSLPLDGQLLLKLARQDK
ncbi:hypothetical protein PoB_004509800 [Plakobranchus ocellatus]|uniref:Uncharacterized protein n=1 Tax=Plakobranchus ocellatus TaxID=259542 RepID=A0AAV4BG70_9GAST|nr:hypothetical protein PoB_004509800 [Plakobranchus ocellatus]